MLWGADLQPSWLYSNSVINPANKYNIHLAIADTLIRQGVSILSKSKWTFVVLLAFALSACGGGSSDPADTTAPDAPVITSPVTGSTVDSSTPTVNGTAEADSSVELFDTDGSTSLGSSKADASGNWSIICASLSDGAHSLTAKATDVAGNTSAASSPVNITVDTVDITPPDPPVISSPVSGALLNSNTPMVSGTAEANSTVELFDTDGTTSLGSSSADASGNWSITSTILTEGAHTLTTIATDAANNSSAASTPVNISIDSLAPGAPIISSPATGTTVNTYTPTIEGSAEAGSSVALFDSDGTSLLGSTTADGSGNWSIVTTVLGAGLHSITARATDLANNTSPDSVAIEITVSPPPPEVSALYPAAPDWNDYVKAADPNLACEGNETGGYGACIHGGEKRTVVVAGYSSCTDLNASDALGVFDWVCDDSTDPVRMVSTGLKSSKAISGTADGTAFNTLIDSAAHFMADGISVGDIVFNTTDYTTTEVVSIDSETQLTLAGNIMGSGEGYSINRQKYLSDLLAGLDWKDNSVTVRHGITPLFTTDPAKWFANPVVVDNDGGSLAAAGTIYLVTSNPLANYQIQASNIALVVVPGVTLAGAGNASYTVEAVSQSFLWLEGRVNAQANRVAVYLSFVNSSVLRNLEAWDASAGNTDTGIHLVDALNNKLSNILAQNNMFKGINLRRAVGNDLSFIRSNLNNNGSGSGSGLIIETDSNDNSLVNVLASGNGNYGLYLDNSSNNTLTNVIGANNGHEGVSLNQSDNNSLTNIAALNNADNGVYLDGSLNNTLIDIIASNNDWYGLSLTWSSNGNSLSGVTAINNGEYGVYLHSSSNNTLSDVKSAKNLYGVYLTISSNVNSLMNLVLIDNSQGLYINGSSYNIVADMIATNNNSYGIHLNSATDNSLSQISSANNFTGIYLSYSYNNTLSNVSVANNEATGLYLFTGSDYNSLTNITSVNNEFHGIYLSGTSSNTMQNLAAANNGAYGIIVESSSGNNYLSGLLKVGNNNGGGLGHDCYVGAESADGGLQDDSGGIDATHEGLCLLAGISDFSATSGITLATAFVGKVADDNINATSYPNGVTTYTSVTDWVNFENAYRGWGVDGDAFPNLGLSNRGDCLVGSDCRIWDWSLKQNDIGDAGNPSIESVLTSPNDLLDGTITHTWQSSEAVTYLRNTVEIMGAGGNNNGLCETDETCLYTPNIGSYQGHGTLQSLGIISVDMVTGVTLMGYSANGYN